MTALSVTTPDSGHHAAMMTYRAPFVRFIQLSLAMIPALVSIEGCIKYTPSHQELQDKNSSRDSANLLGTEEEFNQYERTLSSRLERLLSQRAYLLTADQTVSGYAIGPGDVLHLEVFGFDDIRADTEVSPQGIVTLPLVGDVDVKGRDRQSLQRHLTAMYSRYIKSPRLDISVKSYQSNRVSVIGEVARPGMYPLKRNGQLLTELLSEAGGRNQIGSNRLLLLPAPQLDHATTTPVLSNVGQATPNSDSGVGVEIDLEALMGRVDQRPLLVPLVAGDTVVIPEAGNFEVDGEVQKPGTFKLSSSTSVIGAIAAAGGFTYSANVRNVELIRDIGGGRKALATLDLEEVGLRGGKDIRLRAGDLVRVPSEPGRFFERQIVETLNGVFNGVNVTQRAN